MSVPAREPAPEPAREPASLRPPRRIPRQQLAVWRSFLRAHAVLTRQLEKDLLERHGLPLATYDVLVQLVEAPDRRLRMTELAERVLLSRSGLTRLVDRLEREGLVRREPVPGDARGFHAVLTEAGFARLKEASPTHLAGVDTYMLARLSEPDLEELGRLLDGLLDQQDGPTGADQSRGSVRSSSS